MQNKQEMESSSSGAGSRVKNLFSRYSSEDTLASSRHAHLEEREFHGISKRNDVRDGPGGRTLESYKVKRSGPTPISTKIENMHTVLKTETPPPLGFKAGSLINSMNKRKQSSIAPIDTVLSDKYNDIDHTNQNEIKSYKENRTSLLRKQMSSHHMLHIEDEMPKFDTSIEHEAYFPPRAGIGYMTHKEINSNHSFTNQHVPVKTRQKHSGPTAISSPTKQDNFSENHKDRAITCEPNSSENVTRKPSKAQKITRNIQHGNINCSKINSGFDKIMTEEAMDKMSAKPNVLGDLYLEEIMETGEKMYVDRTRRNRRSQMGWCSLMWYDFKKWRMRKTKQEEWIPIFRKQIVTIEGQFGSGMVSFFIFLRSVIFMNMFLFFIWTALVILPAAVAGYQSMSVFDDFYVRNILDGQNGLENSWFYYGFYTPKAGGYPLNFAYLCCILITYFCSFFIVMRRIAHAIKNQGPSVNEINRFPFANLVMSSWDYSIQAREASENLSMGIANSLRDAISEHHTYKELEGRNRKRKCLIYTKRVMAWLITLILIGSGCLAIYFVITADLVGFFHDIGYQASADSLVVTYGGTVVFMLLNFLIPLCVYQLPKFEQYAKGRLELSVSIGRVFVLRMVNLLALVVSLQHKVKQETFTGCTGTLVGQELYRLVILDTIVQALVGLSLPFAIYYWKREKKELKLPPLVLKVVYRQALIWLGTLVCPLMPFVGIVSMAILFSVTYIRVKITCKPPTKRWSQPRQSSFFMGLLAASLFVLIILVSIIIGRSDIIQLSSTAASGVLCGPFRNETITSVFTDFVVDVKAEVGIVGEALEILVSGTVITPVVFIMIAILYYQYLRNGFKDEHNLYLSIELAQEREQNKELLKKLHLFADD